MSEQKKHPLITRLEALADENSPDRGKLAALRRALQDPFESYPIVLPYLGENPSDKMLDTYALLAALFASHPKAGNSGNMGDHMRMAAGKRIEATERRFANLLRADREDLPFLLRQAVGFIRSKDNVFINWEQLRKDLLAWEHPDQYVQKKWARGFWGHQSVSPTENNQTTDKKE